jgi:hypothetical protein
VYLPVFVAAWLWELHLLVFLQASLPVMALELQSGVLPTFLVAWLLEHLLWSHKPATMTRRKKDGYEGSGDDDRFELSKEKCSPFSRSAVLLI